MGLVAFACISMQGQTSSGQTNIDMSVPGTTISRGILGTNFSTQRPWAPVADRTFITGVAGGLAADAFDWQTRVGSYDWTTIDVLRNIRDSNSTPVFIVNMRGTGTSNGYDTDADFNYTNTNLAPLVTLASEWVRYTNFILPSGPQNANDNAILNKVVEYNGYSSKLLNPGEAAVPKVAYWEIGNEPEVSIDGFYFTNNWWDYTFGGAKSTAEYVNRYKQITTAMKAVDPTIKVGPGMLDNVDVTVMPLLNDPAATIDFWGYHPYDDIGFDYYPNGTPTQINTMEGRLRNVRVKQISRHNDQRQAFINAGRDPDNVDFMATEWNVLSYAKDIPSMYQALGFAESIFTFADLELKAANYWGALAYAANDPRENYPMVKLWQKMNTNIGDTLVNSIIDDANNLRVYTTRDSQTGEIKIWGLNFDNDADTSINLSLSGINAADTATLSVLGGTGTKLWTTSEEWTTQTVSNFYAGNFNLSIPSASIVLLEVSPIPEPAAVGLLGAGLFGLMVRRPRG